MIISSTSTLLPPYVYNGGKKLSRKYFTRCAWKVHKNMSVSLTDGLTGVQTEILMNPDSAPLLYEAERASV